MILRPSVRFDIEVLRGRRDSSMDFTDTFVPSSGLYCALDRDSWIVSDNLDCSESEEQ